MTQNKRLYALKKDREDIMFNSPKTPSKKNPYRDIVVVSTPLGYTQNFKIPRRFSEPGFSCLNTEEDITLCEEKINDERCCFIYKAGEGDFYEVFVNNKKKVEAYEEPHVLYKSRKLCIYDNDYTAVKKSKTKITGVLDRKRRMKEVEILKKIDSEYVTKIYDNWEREGYLYIEMEYCNIGTLRDYINEIYFLKKSKFTPEITKKMMFELGSGLKAIHSNNIVHLDIKPENILMKSIISKDKCTDGCKCTFPTDPDSFVFKISDFNISKYEDSEIDEDGDKKYMAPEVLRNICTTSSDIYSLGLIYLEVIREIILPKSGDSWMRLRKNDFRGIKLDRVCKLMLDMDYRKRIRADDVVNIFS